MRWTKMGSENEAAAVEAYKTGEQVAAIAERYQVNPWTIRNAVKRAGVERRVRGGPRKVYATDLIAQVEQRYDQGWSQERIGLELHIHQSRVSDIVRFQLKRPVRRSSQWKGGIRESEGYRYIWVEDDDPMVSMRMSNGYVAEHRLVMARHLGRPLLSTETVHHKDNSDTLNNSLDNLQLRQGKHGKHAAFRCGDCGSENVISVDLI